MSTHTMVQPPSLTRSVVWAIAIASTSLFVFTAALTWAVAGGYIEAVGIGLFCAFWGGPGFGVIAGGAAHALATEARQARADEVEAAQITHEPPLVQISRAA